MTAPASGPAIGYKSRAVEKGKKEEKKKNVTTDEFAVRDN